MTVVSVTVIMEEPLVALPVKKIMGKTAALTANRLSTFWHSLLLQEP